MFIWLIYAIISGIWAKDIIGWIKAVYFIGLGSLYSVIMTYYISNKYQLLEVLKVFPLMTVLHGIIGWWEVITGKYLFIYGEEKLIIYRRYHHPVSTFGNTNDFALFFLFSIIILLVGLLFFKEPLRMRVFYLLLLFSNLGLLYFTSSRACILGLLVGSIFFAYYAFRNETIKKIMRRFFTLSLAILIIILSKIGMFTSQGREDIRITLIKNGIYFTKQTFGFGVGAGNIEYWMANYALFDTRGIFTMHNWLFEILTSYGLIIFILYLFFYMNLFKTVAFKAEHSTHRIDRGISLQLVTVMIAYIFGSISSSSNMHTEWLWVFWGIVISFQGISLSNGIQIKNI